MTATKQTPAIAVTVNESRLILTFSNGDELQLDAGNLSSDIRHAAMMHGLKQKLVDAAAISRDPTNGRAASIELKHASVKEVLERLLAGEWNKRREGGGSSGGLLFRALCVMYDGRKTLEDIKAYLEKLSDKEKAALRKNPKVAAVIDQLRVDAGETGDDLLAELEG
jgi:hypothetical protein